MDKFLLKAFQNLSDIEVPDELHASIFQAATFRRYRKYTFMVTSLIAVTFLFSLWDVYTRMAEINAVSVIKAVIGAFELNLDSAADSARTLFQFLPIQSIILLTLNLTAFVFMIFLLRAFTRLQDRFKTTQAMR